MVDGWWPMVGIINIMEGRGGAGEPASGSRGRRGRSGREVEWEAGRVGLEGGLGGAMFLSLPTGTEGSGSSGKLP